MAAPSGTKWGSTVGSYGRIGIYVNITSTTKTQIKYIVQIWFWSKYSVSDENNTFYYDHLKETGSATTSRGERDILTTVASGSGWSTSNQKKIYETSTYTIDLTTSAQKRYIYAKLAGVDRVGGTMTVSNTIDIPKLENYAVTYNANGGTGAPSSQIKYYGKNLALSSTKPTRTGFTFKGWATTLSGSVAYASGASYTGNAALTLYAVWEEIKYTVTYNANGGTGAPANQMKNYTAALVLSSTKPTRTNYTFKGWGTSANGSVAYAPGSSYTANANITLYAIWELAYTAPRITNIVISRCTSSGTISDEGTYILVCFNWACDKTVSGITVSWTSVSNNDSATIAASGTSGTVNTIVGAGMIDTEVPYDVVITVADSVGNSTAKRTVDVINFPIDFLAGGTGVAIGKAATVPNVFDVYKQTIIRGSEDASGTSASGQFIVGNPDSYHLAMDNNEIMAKNDATTPGNITINYDGGNIGLGGNDSKIAINGNAYMKHGKSLFGTNSNGAERTLVQLNASDQAVFGYGGYSNNEGASYFDGNQVNIRSKGAIAITSPTAGISARQYGVNKVLWSGGYYMTEGHTITLSEAISAQPHGIVLVWDTYSSNAASNNGFMCHFVPKAAVAAYPGKGFDFAMFRAYSFSKATMKHLYINNTTITGHTGNDSTGKGSSGITYENTHRVLVKVIGI